MRETKSTGEQPFSKNGLKSKESRRVSFSNQIVNVIGTNKEFKEPIDLNIRVNKGFDSPSPTSNAFNEPPTVMAGPPVSFEQEPVLSPSDLSKPGISSSQAKPVPLTPVPEKSVEEDKILGKESLLGRLKFDQQPKKQKLSITEFHLLEPFPMSTGKRILQMPDNTAAKHRPTAPDPAAPSPAVPTQQETGDSAKRSEPTDNEQGPFALNFLRNISKSAVVSPTFAANTDPSNGASQKTDSETLNRKSKRRTVVFSDLNIESVPTEKTEERPQVAPVAAVKEEVPDSPPKTTVPEPPVDTGPIDNFFSKAREIARDEPVSLREEALAELQKSQSAKIDLKSNDLPEERAAEASLPPRIELSSGKKKEKLEGIGIKKTLIIQPKQPSRNSLEACSRSAQRGNPTPFSQAYFSALALLRHKMNELELLIKSQTLADTPFQPLQVKADSMAPGTLPDPKIVNEHLKVYLVNKIIFASTMTDRVHKIKELSRKVKGIKGFINDQLALLSRTVDGQGGSRRFNANLQLFLAQRFKLKLMRVEVRESAKTLRYTVVYKDCLVIQLETLLETRTVKAVEVNLLDHRLLRSLEAHDKALVTDVILRNFERYIQVVENVSLMDATKFLTSHFADLLQVIDALEQLQNENKIGQFVLNTEGAFLVNVPTVRSRDIFLKVRIELNQGLQWIVRSEVNYVGKEAAAIWQDRFVTFPKIADKIIDEEVVGSVFERLGSRLQRIVLTLALTNP